MKLIIKFAYGKKAKVIGINEVDLCGTSPFCAQSHKRLLGCINLYKSRAKIVHVAHVKTCSFSSIEWGLQWTLHRMGSKHGSVRLTNVALVLKIGGRSKRVDLF